MTPTPPSPEDDLLDLVGLDKKSKSKPSQQESDFEKELEALFAEDLAEAAETGSSLSAAASQEAQEEPLLLEDLVDDDAPAAQPAETNDEDILDLGSFAAAEPMDMSEDDILDLTTDDSLAEASPGVLTEAQADDDEDILDLSAFAADGPMDLTPPSDAPGGKDGDIDMEGLDNLISDLGDSKKAAPAAVDHGPVAHDGPLDEIDMGGLLDEISVPAAPAAPAAEPADEMLDLSLGDLVEGLPEAEPLMAEPLAAAETAQDDLLDLTLPDLSDPEPGADLLAGLDESLDGGMESGLDDEQDAAMAAGLAAANADLSLNVADTLAENLAANLAQDLLADLDSDMAPQAAPAEEAYDLSGAMNLSMPEVHEDGVDAEGILEASGIDGGLLGDFDGPMPEISGGAPMDADTLLDQIDDGAVQPALEPVEAAGPDDTGLNAGLALAAGAVLTAGVAAAALAHQSAEPAPTAETPHMPEPMRQLLEQGQKNLEDFQQKLAELKTQVTGGSITVVSIQGQLAEKDQVIAALDERLRASEAEAEALRQELTELRLALEEGLALRSEEEDKNATVLKERLALLEDRQDQAARDMHTEIERAVPREAAKVIREEISALAESMRD